MSDLAIRIDVHTAGVVRDVARDVRLPAVVLERLAKHALAGFRRQQYATRYADGGRVAVTFDGQRFRIEADA